MVQAKSCNKKGKGNTKFPERLHEMMQFVEKNSLESVVSWILNGRGFMIHDPERLVNEVLPMFFSQTKYRSFRRQLCMWHFERIPDGPNKGGFMHPYFMRGNRSLCAHISREVFCHKKGSSSITSSNSLENENNSSSKPQSETIPQIPSFGSFGPSKALDMDTNQYNINRHFDQTKLMSDFTPTAPAKSIFEETRSILEDSEGILSSCLKRSNMLVGPFGSSSYDPFGQDLKNADLASFAGRNFFALEDDVELFMEYNLS